MKFTTSIFSLVLSFAFFSCSNKSVVEQPHEMPGPDTSSSKIVYWLTSASESSLLKRQPSLAFASSSSSTIITIDTAQTFQSMDGGGYTLTGGSASLIYTMPSAARADLLQELFGNGENSIGISYLRLSIGASDLSDTVYTYDDMPDGETDPDLSGFSIAKDQVHLIPLLKEILAISPNIKIIATPWTAPSWMKDNDSSAGGSLRPEYYAAYANYFVKYVQAMHAEGITITAITPQNEPLNDGNNPSLVMQAAQQADFIRNNLGPAFQQAQLTTKIIVYDHNCDQPDYPLTILNDAGANSFVDGSAFHLYRGDISALSQVHAAHPDKNVYFTEQYTSSTGQFGGDLRWHLKNIVIGAPRNWSKTVFEWNLANDVNFGPYTPGGCTTCKGAITINGSAVKRNVAYYIMAHFSKFVPPGSIRIASNVANNIQSVAFLTPAKQKVLIVLNDGDAAASFNIRVNDRIAGATLSSGDVATYVID